MLDINLLKSISSRKIMNAGDVLVSNDEGMGNSMYIILKGTAEVYKNYKMPGEIKISQLEAGDFFGEMSLFLNKERTDTVVALEDIVMLEIDRINAYELFEKEPSATYALISALCQRLDDLILAYEKLSMELGGNKPSLTLAQELFLKGHKEYSLRLEPEDGSMLYEQRYYCAICDNVFKAPAVKDSSLKLVGADYDMRPRYQGVDTLYYDVVTCPQCGYSALANKFEDAVSKNAKALREKTGRFEPEFPLIASNDAGAASVFARLHLALLCAPLCFASHELAVAQLWQRIHWLYGDCKDERLETYAARQAYEAYMVAFEKADIPPDQLQQLYMVMAELSYKTNDIKNAKHFLLLAKTCEEGKPALKRRAEDRLRDIS